MASSDEEMDGLLHRITQYHAALLGKNNGKDYADAQKLRLLKLFAGCKMESLRDIDHRIITKWLTTLGYKRGKQEHEASVRTRNHYAGALRTFGEWLLEQDILEFNPFRRVVNVPAKGEEVIQRRAITVEEQEKLLSTVVVGGECLGGLPAVSRAVLYFAAMATGLRARELARLIPDSFDWTVGTVTVEAKNTKNKQKAVLSLHPDLLPQIKAFVEQRSGKLWPGKWYRRAAKYLKKDLAAAGIDFIVNDKRLDFHALRHTFNTGLGLAEIDPRVNQQLARHSTLELTMSYTHLPDSRHKEGLAKLKLPKFPELPPADAA